MRAKLIAWSKTVDEEKDARGGEDQDIWKLEPVMTKEQRQKEAAELAAAEKAAQEAAMDYNVHELLRRILKVEKLSEKVKDMGPTGF